MKIVAFAGSNSKTSINKELVKYTVSYFPNAEINLLDLNNFQVPIYSPEEEEKEFPEAISKFLDCFENAQAIVCSMAEHNSNFSAAFKNLFDWASRKNRYMFQNKPMLLLSTSPGGLGGSNVMNIAKNTFPRFGADLKATFSLPKFGENFDAEKGIINDELKAEFEKIVDDFKKQILY